MDDSEAEFEAKFRVLRQKYLNRCRERVDTAMRWATEVTYDSKAVHKLHAMAHEMAGSGATYGFPRITVLADRIEQSLEPIAKEGTAIGEDSRAEELTDMLDQLREAIPEEA